jgi:RHS repeat-associated protein
LDVCRENLQGGKQSGRGHVAKGDGAYGFAYNGDAEVTSVDNNGTPNVPHVVLNEAYDALGDRTSLTATIAGTADFANTYAYNDDQQLSMVQQQGVNGGNIVSPKEVDYGYNAIGQFSGIADFNYIGVGPREDVLTGTCSYDTGARLTGIAYTSAGGTNAIDALGWGYDAANNVTSFSSIDGTATYGYDPTNQLTSATYTTAQGGHQPANESFSFDANRNRNSTGYTTGSDNLMTSDGTFTYQHDADGNTTSRTQIASTYSTQYQTTYSWDYRNRLTDVEYYDNNNVLTKHVHFVYDVFDHLIATDVDPNGGGTYTEVEHYVLDVSPEIPQAGVPGTALAQPVLQFDGSENLTMRYLVGLDPAGQNAVVAQETVPSPSQGGPVIWAADNNVGTPLDLVDNTGALASHRVYSAFGEDVYDSDPSLSYWVGFAGGHVDPNAGLINNYHRWYDPATGRWLSEDPKRFAADDANLSRYVGNGPGGRADPTGEAAQATVDSLLAGLRQAKDEYSAAEAKYTAARDQFDTALSKAVEYAMQLKGILPEKANAKITGIEDYVVVQYQKAMVSPALNGKIARLQEFIDRYNKDAKEWRGAMSFRLGEMNDDMAQIKLLQWQLFQLQKPTKPN